MFDFLGRRKVDRRGPAERRRTRGPITIGFEQLEGREMLSSGLVLTIIPSGIRPPVSLPRPLVGSIRPEDDGEGLVVVATRPRTEPVHRWNRPWPVGRWSRLWKSPDDER